MRGLELGHDRKAASEGAQAAQSSHRPARALTVDQVALAVRIAPIASLFQ
ncbi:hypothetical protein [Mycobacterium sp. 29Ha]|nr:hypothetical protein [Mycobacterium sp. 29Ha]MDV3134999.1 hypothetical protein [Mycobacterium sp. 29Ha]